MANSIYLNQFRSAMFEQEVFVRLTGVSANHRCVPHVCVRRGFLNLTNVINYMRFCIIFNFLQDGAKIFKTEAVVNAVIATRSVVVALTETGRGSDRIPAGHRRQ